MSRAANFPSQRQRQLAELDIHKQKRLGMSRGLHSSCQAAGTDLQGFYVPLVDFPTCARFDVSIQCIGRSLCMLVPHRIVCGRGERLDAKCLMRIGSAFAVIEPCGSL